MVWVRPGVLLVFAILLPTSELIRLDLPTLERPRKAISGTVGAGNWRGSAAEVMKWVVTFMLSMIVVVNSGSWIDKNLFVSEGLMAVCRRCLPDGRVAACARNTRSRPRRCRCRG